MSSSSSQQLSPVESAKRQAARAAVDEFVRDGQVLGIGSGSTVVYAVERVAERVVAEGLSLVCVPTSFQATQLIKQGGLTLGSVSQFPQLHVAIDGADEVDAQLNLIKGGGGCQLQEKIVASCAETLVVIADYRKDSSSLGDKWKKGIPLEVVPVAAEAVLLKVAALGLKPVLRMASQKAGPVVTDNGNVVIDAHFPEEEKTRAQLTGSTQAVHTLNVSLLLIPGVVETGLFVGMAQKAFFGQADGSVVSRVAPTTKASL
jgi:ribose 5-phosphate isomerase A